MGRNHIADNELDLLNKVKLTAAKQLHYSSKRKGGLGLWENVERRNRQSPTSFNGRQSECTQGSERDSCLLCIHQSGM